METKASEKETETRLFTTEATQQKEHTTQNYSIYSSVAISDGLYYQCRVRTPKAAKTETTKQK